MQGPRHPSLFQEGVSPNRIKLFKPNQRQEDEHSLDEERTRHVKKKSTFNNWKRVMIRHLGFIGPGMRHQFET